MSLATRFKLYQYLTAGRWRRPTSTNLPHTIRIDPQVLEDLRNEAKRRDIGYQTLINDILTEHAKKKTA